MEKRIGFIDISRAFAIIFIVLGHTLVHSDNCEGIFKLLYSFHVMLFFIISGYTFKIKNNDNFLIFLKNKFFRLMIPYFIWAIIFLIPYILFGREVQESIGSNSSFNIKIQLFNILYGNGNSSALKQNSSLWFLPVLFSMEIIYYFVIKLSNKSKNMEFIVLISILFISYITNFTLKIIFPWGINTVLVLGVFFYVGYLFKIHKIFPKNKIFNFITIMVILIVGLSSCYLNTIVSCIDYDYANLTLTLLSGFCLSTVVIYVSYIIDKNVILEYIGKNTMGILIFHKLIILVFQTKFGVISDLLRSSNIIIEFCLSIAITMLSIIFSLFCTKIVKKILPILIGEK